MRFLIPILVLSLGFSAYAKDPVKVTSYTFQMKSDLSVTMSKSLQDSGYYTGIVRLSSPVAGGLTCDLHFESYTLEEAGDVNLKAQREFQISLSSLNEIQRTFVTGEPMDFMFFKHDRNDYKYPIWTKDINLEEILCFQFNGSSQVMTQQSVMDLLGQTFNIQEKKN